MLANRLWGDGSEQIDQIAVRIPEKQRPISPRLSGRLLNDIGDMTFKLPISAINIIHGEFENV